MPTRSPRCSVSWRTGGTQRHSAGSGFEPGTALELGHSDYAAQPTLAEHLATKPADLTVLTCVSLMQVARSGAALYAVSDQWALTMGHLPILRSVLEGAGQVAWLLVGDAPLTGPLPIEPEARAGPGEAGCSVVGRVPPPGAPRPAPDR